MTTNTKGAYVSYSVSINGRQFSAATLPNLHDIVSRALPGRNYKLVWKVYGIRMGTWFVGGDTSHLVTGPECALSRALRAMSQDQHMDQAATIQAMREAGRDDLVHYAGAAHRDPHARTMVLCWLRSPSATTAVLYEHSLLVG
jgi:hypothetical protein